MSEDEEDLQGTGPKNKPVDRQDKEHEEVLLNPQEWEDPPASKVISEFHKTPDGEEDLEKEDPDLEEWVEHWRKRSSYKVISEYHKEGAPFLGKAFVDLPEPPKLDDMGQPRAMKKDIPRKKGQDRIREPETEEELEEIIDVEPEAGPRPMSPEKEMTRSKKKPSFERVLDINTIEFLAYTVIRALLPRRVRYTINEPGIIDMDVAIMDRDIIINSNSFAFDFPDLSIWRIIFAYKGKPVVEMGRGVKNNMKVHYLRAFRVLWDMWRSKKARRKAKRLREKEALDMEVHEFGRKKKKKRGRTKKRN